MLQDHWSDPPRSPGRLSVASRCMDLFVFPHTDNTTGFGMISNQLLTAGKTNCSNFAGPINPGEPPISWMVMKSAPAER